MHITFNHKQVHVYAAHIRSRHAFFAAPGPCTVVVLILSDTGKAKSSSSLGNEAICAAVNEALYNLTKTVDVTVPLDLTATARTWPQTLPRSGTKAHRAPNSAHRRVAAGCCPGAGQRPNLSLMPSPRSCEMEKQNNRRLSKWSRIAYGFLSHSCRRCCHQQPGYDMTPT
jgi:hypothetical protein